MMCSLLAEIHSIQLPAIRGNSWICMTFDDFHLLIKKGDAIALRDAIERQGVSPNLSNSYGWTLLMLAALEGNSSIGQLLLDCGSDVNATNEFGETPLSLAAQKGDLPFVQLLLSRGAATDPHPRGADLEHRLKVASGLSEECIASILAILKTSQHDTVSD